MKKAIFVIDMQNDFIRGPFGTPEADKIVKPMVEYLKKFEGDIFLTKDYHTYNRNYNLKTIEEKLLPSHCEYGTYGEDIIPEIKNFLKKSKKTYEIIHKDSFGIYEYDWEKIQQYDEIEFCGVCTDICVISNVCIVQSKNPFARLSVLENLCAGTDPYAHDCALEVMNNLLVKTRRA